MEETNRYSPRPFPRYQHRPGDTPHPIRDPNGHSFGKETAPRAISNDDWRSNDAYLFAIDLINHGFFWEAHEELEAMWIGSGRKTPTGRFLQGLIQTAAALLKIETAKLPAAQRLAAAAAEKLSEPESTLLGIDGSRLAASLQQRAASGDSTPLRLVLHTTREQNH